MLPDGWMKCDGSVIMDKESVWFGQRTPDLNNAKLFLRGGQDTDVLIVEDDQVKPHNHGYSDAYWRRGSCPAGSQELDTGKFHHDNGGTNSILCREDRNTSSQGGQETRPKNMNIIFILKIR